MLTDEQIKGKGVWDLTLDQLEQLTEDQIRQVVDNTITDPKTGNVILR